MVTNAISESDPSEGPQLVSAASGYSLDIAVAMANEAKTGDTNTYIPHKK